MNPEISIIVPVYNMEQYVCECLDSIKAQTFTNWECIIIDDGSTDLSATICKQYAEEDTRFKIIHTTNGGLSAARNAGLKIARAEFIGFIDSDDYIHPDMYKVLHKLITELNADVVQSGYRYVFKSYMRTKKFSKRIEILDNAETALELAKSSMVTNHMCNKLFRRKVMTCPFPLGRVYEDMFVMSKWVSNINRFVVTPFFHYYYRKRKSSITHVINTLHKKDFLDSRFMLIENLCVIASTSINFNKVAQYKWVALISACKYSARYIQGSKEALKVIIEIRDSYPGMPRPSKTILGRRLYRRARWLLDNPAYFVYIMRLTHQFDIHSRFERHQLFD
ncbi:MAG: glycosyltransferase family 2 protein [Bacteroides sp.]|nr:glycosyltransferase family 2 protein [Bacteroides sp.]